MLVLTLFAAKSILSCSGIFVPFFLWFSTARSPSVTLPMRWDPLASGSVRRSSCCEPSWRCPAPGGISPACSCVSSSACRCTTSSRSTPPHVAGSTAQSAAWYPWTTCVTGRFDLMSRSCCKRCKASRPCSLLKPGLWRSQRDRRCRVPWARPQSPPGAPRGWGGPGSVWSRALGSGRCTRLRPGGRDDETAGPALWTSRDRPASPEWGRGTTCYLTVIYWHSLNCTIKYLVLFQNGKWLCIRYYFIRSSSLNWWNFACKVVAVLQVNFFQWSYNDESEISMSF